MKGEVEYKLTKKMKKRRDLDALVDTVKLPRSRKNSMSAQELLDDHSDSSETEDFTAPPLGLRNKKCCFCHYMVVRVGVFMVCLLSMTTCLGLLWVQWHIRHQIDSLRAQVDSVQSSDTGSVEVMGLKSQLANVNSSLVDLKTGPLQSINEQLTTMGNQLNDLKTKTTELEHSMSAHQDLINIPEKVTSLTKTVATIGNDVKDSKASIDRLTERLTALETPTDKSKSSEEGMQSSTVHILEEEISALNTTLQGQLDQIKQTLSEFSDKLSSRNVDARTSDSNSNIENLVTDLVKDMLSNWTKENPSTGSPTDSEGLKELSEQVSTIMDDIAKLQQRGVSTIKEGDFLAFQDVTQENLHYVNSSLYTINTELDKLSGQVQVLDRSVLNLTAVVTAQTSASGDQEDSSPSDSEAERREDKTSSDQTSNTSGSTTGSPTEAGATEGPIEENVLHMDGVNSLRDLGKKLSGLIRTNNQYSLETLRPLVDKPELLGQYDADGNDLISVTELVEALGLQGAGGGGR